MAARRLSLIAFSVVSMIGADLAPSFAQDQPAKQVFGHIDLPSAGPSKSYGSYAKGCQSGAVALPTEGEGFSGHAPFTQPALGPAAARFLLERFAQDSQKIGWPGLLIGDISQPRGGPMLTGHASHQIGLDVDIWWRKMPDHIMSAQEREDTPFISMLDKSKFLTVDDRKWSPLNARLVMMAASYPQWSASSSTRPSSRSFAKAGPATALSWARSVRFTAMTSISTSVCPARPVRQTASRRRRGSGRWLRQVACLVVYQGTMGGAEEGSERQTAEAAKTDDGVGLAKGLRRHCGCAFRRKVTDCGTKCLHHPCGSGGNRPRFPRLADRFRRQMFRAPPHALP